MGRSLCPKGTLKQEFPCTGKFPHRRVQRGAAGLRKSGKAGAWRAAGKASACNEGDPGSIPGSGRFPWRRKWLPFPVFLPGKYHGQRSLVQYSPWGRKESARLSDFTSLHTEKGAARLSPLTAPGPSPQTAGGLREPRVGRHTNAASADNPCSAEGRLGWPRGTAAGAEGGAGVPTEGRRTVGPGTQPSWRSLKKSK